MSLPATWRLGRVDDLIDGIDCGKNLRCEERPPSTDEIGIVKISAVTWGTFDPSKSKTVLPGARLAEATKILSGDLLISRANTLELVGASVLVDQAPSNLYLSDKVLRLRVKPGWARWLNLFLNSSRGRAEIESRATGNQLSMRNIGQAAIRSIEVPLPPLPEQRRIVARIEALFARTRRARADLERIAPLSARHRSTILAREYEGEQAASLAKHQHVLLAECVRDFTYGTAAKCSPDIDGVPVLRIPNVAAGQIRLDDVKFAALPEREQQKLALQVGDILIVARTGAPNWSGVPLWWSDLRRGWPSRVTLSAPGPGESV